MLKQAFWNCVLVAALASFTTTAVADDDVWIGRKVMPRDDARFKVENREVSIDVVELPCKVTKEEGESVWVERAWVRKSSVVGLDDAEHYYTEYIKQHPESAWAYTNRGVVLAYKGDYDQACEDFTAAIRIDPKSARAYANRGGASHGGSEDQIDRAFKDFCEAIRLNPDYAAAYLGRYRIWISKGDSESGFNDLTEAIRLDPDYATAYFERARLWVELKNDGESYLKDLNQAIHRDPTNVDAYHDRGMHYSYIGEPDKALADLTEVIRLAPIAHYYLDRSNVLVRQGKLDDALTDCTEAIRLVNERIRAGHNAEFDHMYTYTNRGYIFERKGEFDKAMQDFTEAMRLEDRNHMPRAALAWIMATCPEAKYRDGKRAVEFATKAHKSSDIPNFYLETVACAFAEAGDFDKAVKWQTHALKLKKDKNVPEEELKECKERLALFKSRKPYRTAAPQ